MRIRNSKGVETLVGYGIGEQIEVLEPSIKFLVASYEKLKEIPLTDGGFIIEWPDDLAVVFAR